MAEHLNNGVNLLTAEELAYNTITPEIFDRYRERFKDLTAKALRETIREHFIAADPDGLPPMEELSIALIRERNSEGDDIELCHDCGEAQSECECDREYTEEKLEKERDEDKRIRAESIRRF
jgi:hypothetical protein